MSNAFPYNTETHLLRFGKLKVTINCITNFDDLLNALIEKGEDHLDFIDERLPYWADLWHASIALAQYLVAENAIQPNVVVTEIGCGLGLPGIVAAKLGANVTMTDYLPEALAFLADNWKQNLNSSLKTALLDWRNPDPKFKADLLLASDVVYEERAFDDLIPALKILSKPKGRIILTEPSRAMALPFLDRLDNDSDFQLIRTSINIKWDGFYKKVNVLDVQRI